MIPDDTSIGVVSYIPDGRALRLVGLNGIGKTLCAKLLSSISSFPVWDSQQQIDKLSEYVSKFNVIIEDGDVSISMDCDLTKWRYDEETRAIDESTLGNIERNGEPVPVSELKKVFRCYLVSGNEDIVSQIELILRSLLVQIRLFFQERNMNFNEYIEYTERLRRYLSGDGTLQRIHHKTEELLDLTQKPRLISEDSVAILNEILGLLDQEKWDWSTSVENFSGFSDRIKTRLMDAEIEYNTIVDSIDSIRDNLDSADMETITEFTKSLEAIEKEIDDLDPPLSLDEFPDNTTILNRQDKLAKKTKELFDLNKRYNEIHFRQRFWDSSLSILDTRIDDYEVDRDIPVLLQTDEFDEISAEDLIEWAHITTGKGEASLRDVISLNELTRQKRDIETEQKSLTRHAEFLKELESRLKKQAGLRARLARMKRITSEAEHLPELINRKHEYSLIISRLNEVVEKARSIPDDAKSVWDSSAGSQTYDLFRDEISRLYRSDMHLRDLEEELSELEEHYTNLLRNTEIDIVLPDRIKGAVDDFDLHLLFNTHEILMKTLTHEKLRIIRNTSEEYINRLMIAVRDAQRTETHQSKFVEQISGMLSEKLITLLNMEPYRNYVFNDAEVKSVNITEGTLELLEKDEIRTRFISDYSSGEKAFTYAFSTILNLFQETEYRPSVEILFLDEFGALLSIDRMNFLTKHLDELQAGTGRPSKYILVSPYKGELEKDAFSNLFGDQLDRMRQEMEESGYTYFVEG